MTAITYSALRNLSSGHVSGTAYDLDFDSQTLDESEDFKKTENKSIGGIVEAVLHYEEVAWQVKTAEITKANLPLWKEFFSSCAAREVFTFDAYGTIASPDNAVNATLIGSPKKERINNDDFFTYSFKVRIV